MKLLTFAPEGIYCQAGDFYIDPWRKVKRAIVTHAHADHARPGMGSYLCHKSSASIMRKRLGANILMQTLEYGEQIDIKGVKVSLHPAGHIIGSAQVRVEYQGEVWVAAGDYKTYDDDLAAAFEPVKCHTFITESTFGLPIYHWRPRKEIFADINQWWQRNAENKICTVLAGYSLGKAQTLLAGVDPSIGPIYLHGAVHQTNAALMADGAKLPDVPQAYANVPKENWRGALIICPPSATNQGPWLNKFGEVSVGVASGWMQLRGFRRRSGADRGFVISDHADWPGLISAIKDTEAENVIVTHGYTATFAAYLRQTGINAQEAKTEFTGENLLEATEVDIPELNQESTEQA